MATKTAIVCIAYGTDPTGYGPSPMMKDIIRKAEELSTGLTNVGVFLQGGYTFNGGPTESEIMAKMVTSGPWIQEIFLDTTSMNTVEGVDELARLIRQNGYHRVHVVAESFHARRVALTFARRTPDLPVVMHTVHTPFGGNSQDRLNSAWRWWPWEIAARIYTFVLVH